MPVSRLLGSAVLSVALSCTFAFTACAQTPADTVDTFTLKLPPGDAAAASTESGAVTHSS